MMKQTYERFPNTVCELRKDNDGIDQIIVAFLTNEFSAEEKMFVALDDGTQFSHCFRYLDYDQQVQFF